MQEDFGRLAHAAQKFEVVHIDSRRAPVDFRGSIPPRPAVDLTALTRDARLQRALQALRDVRHLLPAEGVAVVDAVLDHPMK